jgi:hypothetical protein
MRPFVRGLVAGAAGTMALDAASYLDIVVRGRPPSTTPQETVKRLAAAAGINLGEGAAADNRAAGLGALLGYATGLGTAATYAVLVRRRLRPVAGAALLSALAMLGSNTAMAVLGVTDPRRWSAADWVADIVPHLAYGVVAAAVDDQLRAADCRNAR